MNTQSSRRQPVKPLIANNLLPQFASRAQPECFAGARVLYVDDSGKITLQTCPNFLQLPSDAIT